jgi:PhoH-like ATPase
MRKNYILDANILLHDPHSIFHFADNVVIIPVDVISEIDRFKKERTDRGYNARNVVRLLDGLRGKAGSLMQGVELDHGGLLRVYCEPDRVMTPNHSGADVEILRTARRIQDAEPDRPAIIVTKDINLRIRADAIGLRAEDYESDRVKLSEVYSGQVELEVTGAQLAEFREHGALNTDRPLAPNEYALLRTTEGNRASALARADGSGRRLAALHEASSLWGVKPRNKEQYFAIDALLDDDIKLVTLLGKAGTGKTLLAIAAAMQLTLKLKRYRGMLVCRPIVPLGRDIGYLPGDIGQKLDPWMKPIADTVEFLLDAGGEVKGFRDADGLIGEGPIEIMPLTFVRGRSIANRFVVIDEAQNLTPLEVKTVITRMGVGAKVVLTGDPYQIDNPYVDANSNGFTYLINHFRGEAIAAHIELRKGERSALAELAANLL